MAQNARERLITSAAEIFAKSGFNSIGLDRIINEVGVTKTTFYNHFDSKDALILAVIEHQDKVETEYMLAEVTRIAGADPIGRILAVFDVLDAWFQEPDFRGCVFMNAANEFPNPNDPIHRAAVAHGEHLFEIIREYGEQGGVADASGLASQMMIIITGAVASRQSAGMRDAAKAAKCAASALLSVSAPKLKKPAKTVAR